MSSNLLPLFQLSPEDRAKIFTPKPAAPAVLPPDPDALNDCRAEWAGKALDEFIRATGTGKEDAVSDLISDLMHWCDRNGGNFQRELKRGMGHYAEETGQHYSVTALSFA